MPKKQLCELSHFFLFACFCQLVPELLLKLSDTLHIQYRYIEHVHEEVSCKKLLFSKMAAYLT